MKQSPKSRSRLLRLRNNSSYVCIACLCVFIEFSIASSLVVSCCSIPLFLCGVAHLILLLICSPWTRIIFADELGAWLHLHRPPNSTLHSEIERWKKCWPCLKLSSCDTLMSLFENPKDGWRQCLFLFFVATTKLPAILRRAESWKQPFCEEAWLVEREQSRHLLDA